MNFWVVIKNQQGDKKKIRPGERLDPDWEATGEIEQDGVPLSALNAKADQKIQTWAAFFGISTADFLTAAGKALGISCSYCQLRDQVLRRIDDLGKAKAAWMITKSVAIQVSFWRDREVRDEELKKLELELEKK